MIELLHIDCMEYMSSCKDKQFELAIVDPPYGIGEAGGKDRRGKSKHKKKGWDKVVPHSDYFGELKRVSKNQIIWGANYMIDNINHPSMGWVCWDKKLDNSDFSDFELAFTSFDRAAKIFRYSKNGGSRTAAALLDIIHPCQKPIKLYKWLLKNYAKQGDKIIDTHGGSMSIACAVDDVNKIEKMDLSLVLCEIDKDYYDDGCKRFKEQTAQLTIL